MMRVGMSVAEARALLDRLPLEVVPFERTLAYRAAELVAATRTAGLSLGDCACLALAESRQAVAVTSDRAWARIELGIPTQIVR
jgi:PIN domain nuclease of toxin-antitoxin system